MNKIYKVIWSKARNCYVVVSEIAKRNGKCSSSLNRKIIASFLAAGLVTALPLGAEAATKIDTNNQLLISASGAGSGLVWGTGNVTNQAYRGTAFGEGTYAQSNNTTAFGYGTYATQHNATAFGKNTYAGSRQSTAFGANTYAGTVFYYNGEKVTPVRRIIDRYLDSSDPDTSTPKEAWVLVKEDGTFVNTGQRFDGDYDAKGDITYSLNYQRMIDVLRNGWYSANGMTSASGDNQRSATAFGEYSIATGQDATAFGYRSAATAWSATAWGHETAALGKRSTAFGVETWASGNNATAFGYRTEATNENTTAWGSNTEASGVGATAWGSHTISGGDNSTTWGKNSEVGSGSLTYNGETYTNLSIQLTTYDGYDDYGSYTQIGHYYVQGRDKDGKLVTIKERDDEGNPIWKWNYNGTADQAEREKAKEWIESQGGTLAGDYSTAFGDSSRVDAENALGALGGTVNVNATNSAAIGKESSVSSANSYAMGNGATIGTGSDGSVALGGQVGTQTTIGTGATNSFAAIGGTVGNSATNAIAVGGAVSASATSAIAIGNGASATKAGGVALGSDSVASRVAGTVEGTIGYDAGTGKTYAGDDKDEPTWKSTLAAVAVGNGTTNTRQITGVAAGSEPTDAVNVAQLKQVQWQVGIVDSRKTDDPVLPFSHVGNEKSKIEFIAGTGIKIDYKTSLYDNTTGGYGIQINSMLTKVTPSDSNPDFLESITYDGKTYSINNITGTVGTEVKTLKRSIYKTMDGTSPLLYTPYIQINGTESFDDNTNPMYMSDASGKYAIAIGREADALGEYSTAIGNMAEATKPNSTALGYKAHALANNAVALGTATFTTGNRGIAIGTSGTVSNLDTAPDYQRTWAAGQGSIVLGNEARAVTEMMRFSGKTEIDYNTNDAISIGTRADARAMNAIALGGNMSYSDATGMVTYGQQEGNDRDFGATVGEGAQAAIAIGGAYGEHTKDDSGNVTGIKSVTYEAAATYGARSIAIGSGAAIANTEDFLDLKAMVDDTSVGGYQDLRKKYYETRAEYTKAKRDFDDYINANPGYDVNSQDYKDVYVPMNEAHKALYGTEYNSTVKVQTGAVEAFSEKIKEKVALEEKNAVSVADAVAIGSNAQAKTAGAVALGSNSVVGFKDRAGTESKLTGYDERTGAGYIGRSSTLPAWRSTAASVSVGGGTTTYTNYLGEEIPTIVTRRISNVAAGVYDTDAVNVAQLKRAATINSDERNTAISTNDEGEMLLNSPYIHVEGVKEVSNAIAITSYESAEKYKEALEAKKTSLEPKLGYTDAQGREITGSFDQQIASLEADITALNEKADNAPNDTIKNGYLALVAEAEDELADLQARKESAKAALDEVNALLDDPEGDYKKAEEIVAKQSKAYGTDSIAIGKGSVVGEADSTEKGNQSVAIGVDNTVTGNNSIAVGTGHEITGNRSGAFGDPTKIDADDSYAIGNSNTITGDGAYSFILGNDNTVKTADTYVIGSHVNTTYENSVFLGNASGYVEKGDSTSGIAKYDHYDGFGESYKFAGAEAAGVVSVGGYVDGELANRRIQNVAAGLISETSTDAINGSQLYQAIQALSINVVADDDKSAKVVRDPETGVGSGGGTGTAATTYTISAGKTTIEKTKDNLSKSGNLLIEDTLENEETDPKSYHYNIDLNKNIDLGEDGSLTVGESKIDTNGYQIGDTNIDKEGLSIKDGPSVKKDGINAGNKKIENVADGEGANDAVNVSQLRNSGISFNGDSGDSGLIKLGDQYNASFNVNGDNNITTEASAGQLKIKLKEQIDLGENGSVTIGNTTVKNNSVAIEGGPSMTDKGIDAGSQKITNVQAGEADTDAVNVGQLKEYAAGNNQAVANLGNQITGVENRMKKGLAGAAALAALHPLDFDPDDKLTFAAGMGHYRGENAAALGLFYRPDEKVMFSLGGSLGNGENMINAGVSFSLDRTPRKTSSRTAMAREIVELREQVAQLTAIVNQLAGGQLPKPPVMFPNTPENAWAYEYLENLQMKGNIVGYTGRELTRNEFAAALDRAMMSGAKLDERLIKEFEPELSHVRVSHVAGKGEDEGGWYERPRTSHDKLENQHEIAKKPLRPQEKSVTSKS